MVPLLYAAEVVTGTHTLNGLLLQRAGIWQRRSLI